MTKQPTSSPGLLSRLVRRILVGLYDSKGFRFDAGEGIPKRCVVTGAPHTTGWDFIFFLGAATKMGVTPNFLGKTTLFKWPMGGFMRDMGGIPIERSRSGNYVDQVAAEFGKREELALVLAPEGTRGPVTKWKSGFYHIANAAGVPIVPAWVDHSRKCGGAGPAIMPTGDYEADLAKVARFYHSVLPDDPKLAALYAQTGLVERGDNPFAAVG